MPPTLLPRRFYTYLKPTLALILLTTGLVTGVVLVRRPTRLTSLAAGDQASLSLSSVPFISPNQQFVIPVSINTDGAPIIGTDIKLSFDPSFLRLLIINPIATPPLPTFLPVTPGNIFDSDRVLTTANQTGIIEFSAIAFDSSSQSVTSSFQNSSPEILANLTFQALQPGSTTINFDFNPANPTLTTDSNIVSTTDPPSDLLFSVTNLSLVISSPTEAAAPTSTPVPSETPPPQSGSSNGDNGGGGGGNQSSGDGGGGSGSGSSGSSGNPSSPGKGRGDINGDGKTNVFDLSLLLSRYGGSDSTADLNGDGRVNILDLSILLSNWGK